MDVSDMAICLGDGGDRLFDALSFLPDTTAVRRSAVISQVKKEGLPQLSWRSPDHEKNKVR